MEQKGLITQKNRIPERHDLLFVTDAGRKYAVSMKQTAETENIKIPELYEKMLKSAMYAPEKFHELEFLIKTLSDDDVIPEGFDELYNTFKQVIDDE